jgi:hypothetical protein
MFYKENTSLFLDEKTLFHSFPVPSKNHHQEQKKYMIVRVHIERNNRFKQTKKEATMTLEIGVSTLKRKLR